MVRTIFGNPFLVLKNVVPPRILDNTFVTPLWWTDLSSRGTLLKPWPMLCRRTAIFILSVRALTIIFFGFPPSSM